MDRFHLLQPIACGGMAVVWLAERTDRLNVRKNESVFVAIKRIHPALRGDQQAFVLFEREAEIAERFRHKNVVEMLERGSGDSYIAMELVRGLDLGTLVSRARVRRRPLPVDLCAFIAREALRGLAHVHGHGVIHCDVSPKNVLLSFDGEVKLCDFGVARYARDEPSGYARNKSSLPASLAGSLRAPLAPVERRTFIKAGYVAPEQLHGEAWSKAGDLWAAGVMLHELLTGERLFVAPTLADTLSLVDRRPIAPPSANNKLVSRGLDEVVLSLLERDPRRRIRVAAEAADHLDRFVPPSNGAERLARLVTELSSAPEDATDAQPTIPVAIAA